MGGGTSTTTTNIPPPTESELELQRKNVELADIQINALKQQQQFNDKLWATIGPTFDAQARLIQQSIDQLPDPNSPEYKARIAMEQEVQDLVLKDTLERLRAGGGATPKELAALKEAADAAIETGGRDIGRFESDALERLREEVAPSRGLRFGDTPIAQTGAKVLAEGIRARGDLSAKVRSAEAQGRLNAPLAAQQLYGAIGESQGALADAASRFTTDLRESAALGRLRLAGSYGGFTNNAGQFGLNLATGVPFNGVAAADSMARGRYANATTTQRTSSSLLPSLIGAGASIAGAALISTREMKDILATYGAGDPDTFLDALVAMPVHRWRYKGGVGLDAETLHIGPIAEDWQALTGFGSSRTISTLDMLGVLMLAIKALHARVAELEMDAV